MMDKFQCQTHTRTPWGSWDHRYDYRLRYLAMGFLVTSFLAVVIVGVVFMFERRDGFANGTKPQTVSTRTPHADVAMPTV